MKKRFTKILFAIILIVGVVLSGCKKEKSDNPVSSVDYTNGVFIVNEGPFTNGSGTITFLNRDGSGIRQAIYQQANQFQQLGNVVQSMNIVGDKAYVVINNSNKIEVVSKKSFQWLETIDNINQPRYLLSADSVKAFVSCFDDVVRVVNLVNYHIETEIPVGTGPEEMIIAGNHIWVLNRGGISIDSTISVIDIDTKQVVETLNVYPQPSGIQKDKNGNIWVMCTGRNSWHPGGESSAHLVCFDPGDYSVIKDLDFGFPVDQNHPLKLKIDSAKTTLFYIYTGGIYSQNINSDTLTSNPFISYSSAIYSLGLDPVDDVIYFSDALDYNQNGWIYRFDATTGTAIDSFQAGISPGEFYFSK